MRVFVAVPLPDTIKARLHELCQTRIPGVRWEHRADFHITLRFIGDIEPEVYTRYLDALKAVRGTPFSLTVKGTGRFPPQASRPTRILWAGVQAGPELGALQHRVTNALEAAGLPEDKFETHTPHITLGRCGESSHRDHVDAFLRSSAMFQSDTVTIETFVVYQTEQDHGDGKYRQIAAFPLTPSP